MRLFPDQRAVMIHYMRWARLSSVVYTWPGTVEIGVNSCMRMATLRPGSARMYEMMEAALRAGDPRLGPPITGMVWGEARERKAQELRTAYPTPRG